MRERPEACPKGHAYTPENLIQRKARPGVRECRRCARERVKRSPSPEATPGAGRPRGSFDRDGAALRAVSRAEGDEWCRKVLGSAIRASREDANVSAMELASAVGVCEYTIHAWERGATTPALGRLYQIAQAIGVPIAHLVPETLS